MKYILLLFSIVAFNLTAFAQPPAGIPPQLNTNSGGKGKITGKVIDVNSGNGVEFSTITLFAQGSGDLIDGTVADDKGEFTLQGLADGTYKVEISFLGYEKNTIDNVEITDGKTVELGEVQLGQEAQVLNEVTVTTQKTLIEEKVDRMVYNAEKDNLAQGGDAADVLRKVPLLQVDLEGNVSLRGTSNIRVLINNKPSTIIAASVSDALRMIPADMIKTVEVITSPSAKYDAEGSGGIINIITKKNNLEGYYLNLDTGVGLRGSNLGLNGSLRKGNFGMTLGGNGRMFYNKAETEMQQTTTVNGISNVTNQFSDATDNGLFGRYNLGLDYDISKNQFLSGGVRYGVRRFAREQLQTTEIYSDDLLQATSLRNIDGLRSSNNVDLNLDYLRIFKPQQELSVSTLYSRDDGNDYFISDNLDENEVILSRLKNLNDNLNQEVTIQADFQTPFGDNQLLELGAKGISRMVNSDYSYLFAEGANDFISDATRPAGALDYEQNVAAAYTSYTFSTAGKYTFKVGARYELTSISAVQDGQNIEIPDYANLVPSLNISKSLKNFSTIKLGYNRRIQRPWLQQLNPNVDVSNNQDVRMGNPNLKPELSDNIELGYSTMLGKTYLNLSAFGRITDNAINEIRYPIDSVAGAILTTYENIGRERATGINLFFNAYLTSKWTLNGGIDGYFNFLEGQVRSLDGTSQAQNNSGFNFGGRLMTQLQMDKGWSVQAFSFMRGRRVELQGTRGGFGMYALGINKDFTNKKGSIGISAENFIGKGWNVTSELVSPTFTQKNNMLLYNRNIKINFRYKFGSLNPQQTRRKTRGVSNDDLMNGGDSNSGGMDTGGGQSMGGGAPRTQPGKAPSNNKSSKNKEEKKDKE
jgi:outer membrane receptor protein involved in Fe transport